MFLHQQTPFLLILLPLPLALTLATKKNWTVQKAAAPPQGLLTNYCYCCCCCPPPSYAGLLLHMHNNNNNSSWFTAKKVVANPAQNHSLLSQQHDSVLQLLFLWARSHLPLSLGFVRNKLLLPLLFLFLFLPTLLFLSYRLSPLSQQTRNRHYNIFIIIASWVFRQRRSAQEIPVSFFFFFFL